MTDNSKPADEKAVVAQRLQDMEQHARRTLEGWHDKTQSEAGYSYAFEWSEDAFRAAGELWAAQAALEWLKKSTIPELTETVQDRINAEARRHHQRSTSVQSNLMAQERARGMVLVLELLRRYW